MARHAVSDSEAFNYATRAVAAIKVREAAPYGTLSDWDNDAQYFAERAAAGIFSVSLWHTDTDTNSIPAV